MVRDDDQRDGKPLGESALNDGANPGRPSDKAVELELTLSMGPPVEAAEARPIPTDAIDGYRLVRLLGEGGMGVVYEAEQRSPRRRVALKLMRHNHLVDDIHIRLFHREAETLARLRHPMIAAIYESGHTHDGHDFFAMELVRGRTLNDWIASRPDLSSSQELTERLRLFQSICEPVQYAHQRGVIHRDLKPANIMISDHVSDPEAASSVGATVKILDFGLARITDPELQAATMMTEVGAIRGTLAYMSPEQARSDLDAIDVRTDVYALGMILFEMLTNTRPYDLSNMTLVDALRMICEEPPRPLRLCARDSERLDRDLETIVGKALDKDQNRRYGTVAELADDIDRYLGARPILARPPSASYRAQKFAQRHRAGVAAAAVVLLALVTGIVGVVSGLVRARAAETQAHREAATSAKVSDFLADMLASVDAQQIGRMLLDDLEQSVSSIASSRRLDAEEAVKLFRQATLEVSGTEIGRRVVDSAILARAGAAVSERFADEPDVAGHLEQTLAETYDRLGLYEPAMKHARRAVDILTTAAGAHDVAALRSRALVGLIEYRLGRFDEAEDVLREVRGIQSSQAGADHPDTLWSSVRLSWVLIEQGRFDRAESMLRTALEGQRRVLGAEHHETITTMNSLAVVLADQQRYADAEAMHSDVLALRSRLLGPSHPDTLKSLTNLAVVAYYQGRLEAAADLFREVLVIQTDSLGPEHPVTLASINNLAVILERQGNLEEAEALHRRALESKRAVLGADHPETLSSEYNLAIVYTAQGHLDRAAALHQKVFEARRLRFGDRHPATLDSLCATAGVAALRGDRKSALERLGSAVAMGYADGDALAADLDFESLRGDPIFAEIVERAHQNAAAKG
ncbi:MAG: serine/threonine-protein kinase [Holophagae bacterium]|jgi:non-specific serine/threonine protein kinase/serine/threonine-protein kinase